MRILGEQWVEHGRVLKAAKKTDHCLGCTFYTGFFCGDSLQSERDFDCKTMIIIDVGSSEERSLHKEIPGEYR